MTASTITLMPDDTTLPRTRSARKLVLFQRAKGTSTKPARAVSLNSTMVTNSWMARTKKARTTNSQQISSTMMVRKFPKNSGNPIRSATLAISGWAAVKPVPAMLPGCSSLSADMPPPLAVMPIPAKLLYMMSARCEKLPRMKAKAPT